MEAAVHLWEASQLPSMEFPRQCARLLQSLGSPCFCLGQLLLGDLPQLLGQLHIISIRGGRHNVAVGQVGTCAWVKTEGVSLAFILFAS